MIAVKNNQFPIKAVRKDGTEFTFINKQSLTADLLGLDFDPTTGVVTIDGLKFYDGMDNGNIYNVFRDRDYEFLLPCADKVVIDVGANIADSSIFFAANGARVIALEPFPRNFQTAMKNLEANNMAGQVTLLAAGLGPEDKAVNIDADGVGVYAQLTKGGALEVPVYSLDTLIRQYSIPKGSLLKMDCEGCEYDALSESSSLDYFNKIQIEYHKGYERLLPLLKGFDVRQKDSGKKGIGWIYASV